MALLAAPTAIRAEAPPRVEVKTGLRVVATIFYTPGTPLGKGTNRPAGRLAVKVFPEKGGKAVAEVKTDEKGVFVVALPAGKYRVEVVPAVGPAGAEPAKVEVKEGEVSEAPFRFTIALP